MASLIRRLKAAPASDAIAYRTMVAATVITSIAAAMAQQAIPFLTGAFACVAVPVGFVVSYQRRGRRNFLLKLALAAGLFAAFAGFLSGVRGALSIDDTRTPLAALFVWVQVLHSTDVPRRRDLGFSFAASVALLALAGSLSISTGFAFYVAIWAAFAALTLVARHFAELHERAVGAPGGGKAVRTEALEVRKPHGRIGASNVIKPIATMTLVTLVCTLVAFIALPRFPGVQLATLPVKFARNTPVADLAGDVVNPGKRGKPSNSGTGEAFSPDAYFGYGSNMSLRARGQLSNEIALRVRSPEPALWRGQVFDTYTEGSWTSSGNNLRTARASFDQSIAMPTPAEQQTTPLGNFHELTQTYYVERPLPNLIFHAQQATELFVPSSSVEVDDHSGIRLPFILEADTIYSVISRISDATPEELRAALKVDPTDPRFERYLQIPESLKGRFVSLAKDITASAPSAYDEAIAIEAWIRDTKEYKLDIPRDPPGRDPVDVFVFDRNEGFCEQIASTMVLMLRASGVPARIVTGFGPGDRNPFTGYWESRNSDAHAWVEALFPGYGWIQFDPTFGVPEATTSNSRFILEPLLKSAAKLLPVKALGAGLQFLASALGWATAIPLAILAIAGPLTLLRRRRRKSRTLVATGPRAELVSAWIRVERALAGAGCTRRASETVAEFANRASHDTSVASGELWQLADMFNALRYRRVEPNAAEVAKFHELADAVVATLRDKRPAVFATRR